MKSPKLEVSKEEAQTIIQLCDMALRTNGLGAVNGILPLVNKFSAHIASIEQPKPPKEEK